MDKSDKSQDLKAPKMASTLNTKPNKPADSMLEKETSAQFPLGKRNFRMMAIAGGLIVIGFLLMLGGSSTEEAFNPDIFSVRRVVIGPTISFLGFLFMGYAIIRRPSDTVKDGQEK